MKTTFTKTFIRQNKGCYTLKEVNNLSFINNNIITLENIIKSDMPNKDKVWFIWLKCNFDYNLRKECYNQSKKLQEIYSGHGLVFAVCGYSSSYFCGVVAYYPLKKQNIILNEILKYSKKYYEN